VSVRQSSEGRTFQSSPVPKDGCNASNASCTPRFCLFQSSPVPKDGCNHAPLICSTSASRFNPHPSRRTGATLCPHHSHGRQSSVSILTRPEGRVQPDNPVICPYLPARFNPHPSRRTGATWMRTAPRTGQLGFNPHPSRRTGATSPTHHVEPSSRSFNPHPSRRTGATQALLTQIEEVIVSILTRPEGRVQQADAVASAVLLEFQSSPVPKDGCNGRTVGTSLSAGSFNPHPSRRTGATKRGVYFRRGHNVSILTRPEGRVQLRDEDPDEAGFNVSILTRPEGRVQPPGERWTAAGSWFQSSPVPKDGCNAVRNRHQRPPVRRFNPHPSRRTGATRTGYFHRSSSGFTFQSSPVPKDGCNPSSFAWSAIFNKFQSSPVPKDGCNRWRHERR